jgi:NADH:ubiquinone oxidoreductase subunit 6 (subunit J)
VLFEAILFFIAGLATVAGALGVVLLRNPFHSVLALVSHLIALAVLFLLLRAAFIAAAQVVVYASAVMVLYVFVVSYVGGSDDPLRRDDGGVVGRLGPIFAIALFAELAIAIVGSSLSGLDSTGAEVGAAFGSPGQIGELLLTQFLLAFEAASFLLLIAAVGAVVLARKRRGLAESADGPPIISVGELSRGEGPAS